MDLKMLLIEGVLAKTDWMQVVSLTARMLPGLNSESLTIPCGCLYVCLAPRLPSCSPDIPTVVRHAHGVRVGLIVSVDDCLFLAMLILMNWQHRVNELAVA